MIIIFLVFGVIILILVAAIRIILGWILPRSTVKRIDGFIAFITKLYLQIVVVAIAALIVWASISSNKF